MQKFVVLYPPQPDMDAFKAYYIQTHVPLVRKIPGVKAMRYSFHVQTIAGDTQFACIFEADFTDATTMGASLGSAEGQAVAADVANFAQVLPTIVQYTVDEVS